jgi:hypothetical protein
VIPRTLAQNCGANVIRTMTKLRAAHAESSEPRCASATPHARTRTGLLLAGEVEGGKREWTCGLTREVETPLPSYSPHDHMILRVDLVYRDEKVANRDTKVWHFGIENGN